jgi:hypothetical protein
MLTRSTAYIATSTIFSFIVTCSIPLLMTKPVMAKVPSIIGLWESSEGVMNIKQSGSRVSGTYKQDKGAIEGRLSNNVLNGYWSESNSNRRCNTSRNGRYHWGSLRLVFDGSTFRGAWGYCDDAPTTPWTGNRPVPPSISGVWDSSEGEITFKQSGSRISASYKQDGGAIEGRIANNILTGYWSEESSNRRCNTARNGRYHWGSLRFVFDGSTFKGAWGYCDDAPTTVWTGNQKS